MKSMHKEPENFPALSLSVNWRVITILALILISIVWFAAAGLAQLYFVRVRGLTGVVYLDTVTPSRWSNVRVALGNRYIEDAVEALKKGEFDVALRLFRAGVARSPQNESGRTQLAQIYVALKRPDLARDVLIEGYDRTAMSPEFLSRALGYLLEFQFDPQLQDFCDLLSAHPNPRVRRSAALHAAALAIQRGNFDGAESILVQNHLDHEPDGLVLNARADLERGFPDLARARLEALVDSGQSNPAALALLAQVNRDTGRVNASGMDAALRIADDPTSPLPRLELLRQLATEAKTPELEGNIESFFQLFANDQSALLGLGDFAANQGLPELAQRISAHFTRHGWPSDAPALLYAEACIHAHRYADGLAELDRCLRENPHWATRYGPALDGLRSVALYGLNRADDAQLQLEHLLGQPNLRAENLLVVANRLLALGRIDAARMALSRVADLDPKNQAALAVLVRLEAEHGYHDTLHAHLAKFLQVRRPSREVLTIAYRSIGSDLNLFLPDQQKLLAELRQRLGREALPAPRS